MGDIQGTRENLHIKWDCSLTKSVLTEYNFTDIEQGSPKYGMHISWDM